MALFALLLASCGGEEPLTCGKGTRLVSGSCVPDGAVDACGAGTVLQGSTCVPADAAVGQDVTEAGDSSVDAPGEVSATACSPACTALQQCVGGVCEPLPPPANWTCSADKYADGATCHCGCGAADPDCGNASLPVSGCAGGKCQADGNCVICTPQCAGKECGDNGCGGTCGGCFMPGKTSCVAGMCQACQPQCTGKACGDNGCGGQCGTCEKGLSCQFGACTAPPADESCVGHCGDLAPSGCACTADCLKNANCCVDVDSCACLPQCKGKQCGDDGCGGVCGECAPGSACSAGQCQAPVCTDATCNGHGTCLPATGTCDCAPGYAGAACDSCAPGLVGFPNCGKPCSDDSGCDDSNPCTDDGCSAGVSCVHLANSGTCTDGEVCTAGDNCVGGACKPGGPNLCDDSNACTADSCDPKQGCVHLASGATSCEDGDPCTTAEKCTGPVCGGGKPKSCDDGNVCSEDSCDSAVPGGCVYAPSGLSCSLGDLCSAVDVCEELVCTSAAGKDCDDGNDCTVDACSAGTCSHKPSAAKTACDDGDLCTVGDSCDGKGACKAAAATCGLSVTSGLIARYSAASLGGLTLSGPEDVVGWQDQSGLAHHLQPVSGTALPKRDGKAFGGRSGVRLSGSKGLSAASFALPGAASVFATVCVDSAAPVGSIAAHGSLSSGWQLDQDPKASGLAARIASGSQSVSSGQKLEGGHCYVLAGRIGSAATELMQIESLAAVQPTTGVSLPAANQPLFIGSGSAGETGGVVVGELLYFDRAVTDAERDSISVYLRSAWGFDPPQPDFAWYDAADLATLVTATGSAVTLWKDKSGLGRDAAVGGDKAPVWHASATGNGKPALRFDGASVRLQTASVPTSPQMTIFAVYELDAPAQWGSLFNQGHDQYFSLRKTETQAASLNWHIANNNDAPVLPIAMGKWQLVTAVQDATTSTAYLQAGQIQQTKQGPIAAGAGKLSLGNSLLGGQSMGGYLAEVRAYAQALGATDRAFVEAVLKGKFGL